MSGISKWQCFKFQGLQWFSSNVNNAKKPQMMLQSQDLTADGHWLREKLVSVLPLPPLMKKSKILEAILDSPNWNYGDDYGLGFGNFAVGGEYGITQESTEFVEQGDKKGKRSDAFCKSMQDWMELTQDSLAEVMNHEGCGETSPTKCHTCNDPIEDLL
ncbi:hypothetical protein VNI00_017573 [Paramarasmius palmivorus]|uniref:Uncharacterized protein n=1 Tax=Paramarasmius palmivorus TaxID=297713 RepID=A0AAW0B710_9AGAR